MTDLQKDLEQAAANALKRGVEPRGIFDALLTLSVSAAYIAGVDSGEVLRQVQHKLDEILELRDRLRETGHELVIGFKDSD